MSNNILSKKQQYLVVVFSVVLSLLVVWGAVFGATTISTNISTGGTLSVSDTSTLTGLVTASAGFISNASSTVKGTLVLTGGLNASSTATSTAANGINLDAGCFSIAGTCIGLATSSSANNSWSGLQTFTGGILSTASSTFSGQTMFSAPLQASSTLLVNGASTFTGAVTLNGGAVGHVITSSSSVVGPLNVSGPVSASSTLTVSGVARFDGGYISSGSSTVAAALNVDSLASQGAIVASSTTSTLQGIGVATSTPVAEFAANGSATTTAYLTSTKASTGACIEIRGTNGTFYRMYISAGDTAAIAVATTTSGRGATVYFALWEAGSCK